MAVTNHQEVNVNNQVLHLSPKDERDIYAELVVSKSMQLQAQYIRQVMSSDTAGQWETFGQQMLYRTIAEDDLLVKDEKNTAFKSIGIEKDVRHTRDYRTGVNYLGKWLFADITRSITFLVSSLEHIGRRAEGVYEGDIQFESVKHTVKVYLADTVKQVDNYITGMRAICKKSGVEFPFSNEHISLMRDKVYAAYRVYRVYLEERSYYPVKDIGYIVIHRDFSNTKSGTIDFEAYTIIDYDVLINNWIVIDPFMNQLLDALPQLFKTANCRVSSTVDLISRTDFAEAQADIIERNAVRVKDLHDKVQESINRTEELKKQRAAEKEAAKLANRKKRKSNKKQVDEYDLYDFDEDDEDYPEDGYSDEDMEPDFDNMDPAELKALWVQMSATERKAILESLDETTRKFVELAFGA